MKLSVEFLLRFNNFYANGAGLRQMTKKRKHWGVLLQCMMKELKARLTLICSASSLSVNLGTVSMFRGGGESGDFAAALPSTTRLNKSFIRGVSSSCSRDVIVPRRNKSRSEVQSVFNITFTHGYNLIQIVTGSFVLLDKPSNFNKMCTSEMFINYYRY